MASDSTAKEIARLVTHFEGVLETLNTNINRYRESKAAEFTALCEEQLAGTANHVAEEVRNAIQGRISKFPELNGFTIDPVASEMAGQGRPAHRSHPEVELSSSPPVVFAPAESAEPSALEPSPTIHREELREHDDLAGIVIPEYLPLLEAAKTHPKSDSQSRSASGHQPGMSQSGGTDSMPQSPPEPATPEPGATSPLRSDSTRRSALRRSSSASKSPRKVRFHIGGLGGDDGDLGGKQGDKYFSADDGDIATRGSGTYSKFPPSTLDDPYEALPPRKVSSVEKLRLLGRRPYQNQEESDADAPPAISLNEAMHKVTTEVAPTTTRNISKTQVSNTPLSGTGRLHNINPRPVIDLNKPEASLSTSLSDNDEGVLPEINVKKFKNMRSSSAQSSTQTSPTSPTRPSIPFSQTSPGPSAFSGANLETKQPGATTKSATQTVSMGSKDDKVDSSRDDDDEDGIFMFDEEHGVSNPILSTPSVEEDLQGHIEEEVEETTTPDDTKPEAPMAQGIQSTQPREPIRSLLADGIGSYKGQVLKMRVVKDPTVYAEAASMGEFNTFVGGIDGASGMDEGDFNSFRASVAPFPTGSPKSFSERLMMEDVRLAMRNQQSNFGSLPIRPTPRR